MKRQMDRMEQDIARMGNVSYSFADMKGIGY